MRVNHTSLIRLCAVILIAITPLKAIADDVSIGGVPLPADVQPGAGPSPFLGAWFGT